MNSEQVVGAISLQWQLHSAVFGRADLHTRAELESDMDLIELTLTLDSAERDTLIAAFKQGPLDDGDVPSKTGRNGLLEKGLVAKTISKGQWGFNACTYKGAWAYKILEAKKKIDSTLVTA